MKEQATITEIDSNGNAWAVPQSDRGCGHCASQKGCGVALFSRFFGNQQARINVKNSVNARVGDQVIINVPDKALTQASLLAYLFPLVCLLVFASVAQFAFKLHDAAVIVVAFAGLLSGFLCLSFLRIFKNRASDFQPVILSVVKSDVLNFKKQGTFN